MNKQRTASNIMAVNFRLLPFFLAVFVAHGIGRNNYAPMGVCENIITGVRRCAFQKSDCEPSRIDGERTAKGETYITAHQQRLQNRDSECGCHNTPIGACWTSSQAFSSCASNTNLCRVNEGEYFGVLDKSDSTQCGCVGMTKQGTTRVEREQTRYGACQDVTASNKEDGFHFCAISPSDCESPSHAWVQPEDTEELLGKICNADHVRVGGCVGGFTKGICAVSEDDCVFADYLPPLSLKQQHNQECYLSKPHEHNDVPLGMSAAEESGTSVLVIVFIALGAVLGGLLLIGILIFIQNRKSKISQAKAPDDVKEWM